jgi:hypothetical protein
MKEKLIAILEKDGIMCHEDITNNSIISMGFVRVNNHRENFIRICIHNDGVICVNPGLDVVGDRMMTWEAFTTLLDNHLPVTMNCPHK